MKSLSRGALEPFAEFCRVQSLIVFDRSNSEPLLAFAGNGSVKHVEVSGGGIKEPVVAMLADLRGLVGLNLNWSAASPEAIASLSRVTQLKELQLWEQDAAAISAALKSLSSLPRLQKLELIRFAATESDFEQLARFPALETLVLTSPDADDGLTQRLKEWQTAHPWMDVFLNGRRTLMASTSPPSAERPNGS